MPARPRVLLGQAMTVLLLFGGGLALGNLLGGKLADRAPMPAVIGRNASERIS